jgi:VWFA-related protein
VSAVMQAQVSRRQFLEAAACSILAARAQDSPTFSTEVKVVNLLAIVRTKKGEIIRNLVKDDFEVLENGRPQTIRYFSQETDLPLTIGLLVDTSMSQRRLLTAERSASFDFLDQVLREKEDQLFLMQFDMAVLVRQQLTSSHQRLEDALALVDTPTRSELESQNTRAGTLLFDAVVQASRDFMTNQRNRKALIILTDGVDTGSDATLDNAIQAAQRADTLVYSILFSDSGAYGFGFGPDGKRVLQRLARETGGSFFEVSKKQPIQAVYKFIEQELRSQYSLGFVSDQPVRVSEFRTLQLKTKEKDLIVQARDRYWAQR